MVAESAKRFEALEALAGTVMGVFAKAGFERVAPAVLQPADVFLDVIGESIRGRTYVFTDPDGDELCLRPDLTVPTCRLYLERHPKADARARYCYNGPAFRFQPGGGDARQPREFRQAGVECFAIPEREKVEAEIVALAVAAVRAAGLETFKLRFGDLGLFRALLEAIDMPERWRARLMHDFWHREAFQASLTRFANDPGHAALGDHAGLIDRLDPEKPDDAEAVVADYLEQRNIPLIGARTLGEITEHLLGYAADARAEPLSADKVALIEAYIAVTAPPKAAGARIEDLMRERGIDLGPALSAYQKRLDLMMEAGLELAGAEFSAEFGRDLEYYTGLVFEIEVPDMGKAGQIAGGGRYDGLLRAIGAPQEVPGIGVAIHTERLLHALEGEGALEGEAS